MNGRGATTIGAGRTRIGMTGAGVTTTLHGWNRVESEGEGRVARVIVVTTSRAKAEKGSRKSQTC